MTEKLYYQDVFMKEFSAEVQEIRIKDGAVFAALDRTAFYPEGGGQLADTGQLRLPDGKTIEVTDVQEEESVIWHAITESLEPGIKVVGTIDWDRRFDHMQQHSGEHIVSGMICSAFHCNNVGFHMGEELITIDYDTRLAMDDVLDIEAQANKYIWEDHEFEELWPSGEELAKIDYRSKKEIDGDVRITSFPGADTCACCGTHVASSAQVGMVKFLSAKNFHEGTRLELLCGKRAFDYLAMNYVENKAVAVQLSTSEKNTASFVGKLLEEHNRIKSESAVTEEQLMRKWAEGFEKEEKVLVIEDWMSPVQGRHLADLAADRCGMVAVFAGNAEGYNYSLIKRDGEISEFVKEMNQALNGRGGGRNGFAQGSVKAGRTQIKKYMEEKGFSAN